MQVNMKWGFTIGLLFLGLLFSACRQNREEIITKRIQYDVNIKSPDPNYDWWIQNLAGEQREHLVRLLLKGAKSGKYPAYDYYYHPLSRQAVANILTDTIVRKLRRAKPPYDLRDTLIIERIQASDIQRLRFMEEWRVDRKNFAFEKKVVGIAPVARRFDQGGKLRWQPLFWIFPDKEFLNSLKDEP